LWKSSLRRASRASFQGLQGDSNIGYNQGQFSLSHFSVVVKKEYPDMTIESQTFRPWLATAGSVALVCCLWLVGCTPPADKSGGDGSKPADTDAHDHDHDGEDHDAHDHEHGEKGHTHADEEKGGDDEAAADPGPKVDPESDDLKAGEPSFPKLPNE
jgi:hypothetical protein